MKRFLRRWLHRFVLRNLFNAITEYDIIRQVGGKFVYRDAVLPNTKVRQLAEEARFLTNLDVLQVLLDDMRYVANKRIYMDSTNTDDIIFGKAMLYSIDVLQKKINNMANLK